MPASFIRRVRRDEAGSMGKGVNNVEVISRDIVIQKLVKVSKIDLVARVAPLDAIVALNFAPAGVGIRQPKSMKGGMRVSWGGVGTVGVIELNRPEAFRN